MTSKSIIAFRFFVATWTCLTACSCASRSVATRDVLLAHGEQLLPLGSCTPPLSIDVASQRPFSRFGIPWDDTDIVGLDVVWLLRTDEHRKPLYYVLVVNEYTKDKGLLCLVSGAGSVIASTSRLGIIQRVRLARIAPIADDQFLVYANPDHASGACIGEVVLLRVVQGEFCELLKVARYQQASLGGEVFRVTLPLLIRENGGTRVAVPIFDVRVADKSQTGHSRTTSLGWSYLEYEWDARQQRFSSARVLKIAEVLTPDAWQWLPNYDSRDSPKAISPPENTGRDD